MKVFGSSLTKVSVACLLGSSVLLMILWHVSTPSGSGPLGILVVFMLIYVFFTALALLLTGAVSGLASKLLGRAPLPERRRYYISSVLGFLPVIYLTLLSMGGASVWGIGLITLFTVLMLFYVLRRT